MVLVCRDLLFVPMTRNVTRLVNHLRNRDAWRLVLVVGFRIFLLLMVTVLSLVIWVVVACLILLFIFIHCKLI